MNFYSAFFYFIFLFISCGAWAQGQKAVVVNNGALVYKEPDFDAPVLAQLKAGQVFDVSQKTKGPFYKIRLKPGVLGWIADIDVRPAKGGGKSSVSTAQGQKKEESAPPKKADSFIEKKRVKSFYASRYRGPVGSYLTFSEKTMGKLRTENMSFYGLKVAGPNTMFSGDFRTDAEFLFHVGAPKYYEKLTGYPASGWIFLTDFIFETASPQSTWHMLTYGFGPMFKYSHFQVSLLENGREVSYSLDDMALGAVFDVGLAFRIVDTYALRFNVKYYWEKTKYWGGSLTFGFPF